MQALPPHTCTPLVVAWLDRLAAQHAQLALPRKAALSLLRSLTNGAAPVRPHRHLASACWQAVLRANTLLRRVAAQAGLMLVAPAVKPEASSARTARCCPQDSLASASDLVPAVLGADSPIAQELQRLAGANLSPGGRQRRELIQVKLEVRCLVMQPAAAAACWPCMPDRP